MMFHRFTYSMSTLLVLIIGACTPTASNTGGNGNNVNCQGCLDSFNQCVFPNNDKQCGKDGAPCEDCEESGLACNGVVGKCDNKENVCTPDSCKGCCNAAGACIEKVDNNNCGSDGPGTLCKPCGAGTRCIASKTLCVDESTLCDVTECAKKKGCCFEERCIEPGDIGFKFDFCGNTGQECGLCRENSKACSFTHTCVPKKKCDNCDEGCCDEATGNCVAPELQVNNEKCGSKGETCRPCYAKANESCVNNKCVKGN